MRTRILTSAICIVALFSVDLAYGRYPVSPYAYCSNNPVNRVDPDGKDDFFFNSNGELLNRIRNDRPDLFYHTETSRKTVYSWSEAPDGSMVRTKSFIDVTTNNLIDMGSDLGYMIRTVYAEAGGTNAETRLAVAEIIRNRANDETSNSADHGWAATFSNVDTYKAVVTQSGQFESVGKNVPRYSDPASVTMPNGRRNESETNAFVNSVGVSINATRNNTNTAQGAMYFFDTSISAPGWTNYMQQVTIPNASARMKFYRY